MKYLLRIGLVISILLILSGGITFLVKNGTEKPNYKIFENSHSEAHQQSDGKALINGGIFILALIPLAFMLASFIIFAMKKDILYAALSFVVATLLSYSLLIGLYDWVFQSAA